MKSLCQQVFDVISLFGKRIRLLQGVCVQERKREEVGGGQGERERKRLYNIFLPWVDSCSLTSPWLLRDGGPEA